MLSATIITFNEERNIERCLLSLKDLCDEIVVVDSGSNDRTVEIALALGAKVIHQPFLGHIGQKNFAITQASGDWILSLDADEALDDQLKKSVKEAMQHPEGTAYAMNRLTSYCGHWVHHSGWYPDTKVRLFKKGQGQWSGVNPHDYYQPNGNEVPKLLKGDILHYSYYTAADHFKQIEFFGRIASEELFARGKKVPELMIWLKVIGQFIKSFFLRAGFLDGKTGWLISVRSAYATLVKYRKLAALHSSERKRFMEMKHIIVSRPDSIGDVMLTLPVCGRLKELNPQLSITFLCKKYTAPVVQQCRNVDAVVTTDELTVAQLHALNADAIIHVFPDEQIMELSATAGIPLRIATAGRKQSWKYANARVRFSRKNSDLHEAQLNFKLLQPLGILETPSLAQLASLTGFEAPSLTLNRNFDPSKLHIVLHPLSQGSAAEWGIHKFQSLVDVLSDNHFQFYITGTEKEGQRIREQGGISGVNVEDVTGTMSLTELIAFINQCDVLVAASTGPLHIASSLGKTAIGLYPDQRPMHPGRWAAIGKKVIIREANINSQQQLNIAAEEIAALIRAAGERKK